MARTFTETLGMIEALLAYMQNPENKDALTAKDFDSGPHSIRLTKNPVPYPNSMPNRKNKK